MVNEPTFETQHQNPLIAKVSQLKFNLNHNQPSQQQTELESACPTVIALPLILLDNLNMTQPKLDNLI